MKGFSCSITWGSFCFPVECIFPDALDADRYMNPEIPVHHVKWQVLVPDFLGYNGKRSSFYTKAIRCLPLYPKKSGTRTCHFTWWTGISGLYSISDIKVFKLLNRKCGFNWFCKAVYCALMELSSSLVVFSCRITSCL